MYESTKQLTIFKKIADSNYMHFFKIQHNYLQIDCLWNKLNKFNVIKNVEQLLHFEKSNRRIKCI